jgi:DNA-directed RNA polymerase III subunit RPC3
VQQGLVYYNADDAMRGTFYEANPDAAYGLVRSGKILEAVESRYGASAKDVVESLFLLGHTKVSDLEKVYESRIHDHANGNGESNGNTREEKLVMISTGQLHAILTRLLEAAIIQPVVGSMLCSPTDTYEKIEYQILKESFGGSTKGAKQKEELKVKVRDKLQALRSERQNWQMKGKKRPLNGSLSNGVNGVSKRRRLSNSGASVNGNHDYEDDGARVDVSLPIFSDSV